jgi:hypothetical protein
MGILGWFVSMSEGNRGRSFEKCLPSCGGWAVEPFKKP